MKTDSMAGLKIYLCILKEISLKETQLEGKALLLFFAFILKDMPLPFPIILLQKNL